MIDKQIYYWPVESEQMGSPIRISKRVNQAKDSEDPRFCLHWHEQLEFQYVRSGGIYMVCNGYEGWIYKNDISFVNWCDPHRSIRFLDDTQYYVIQLDLSRLIGNEESKPCMEKFQNCFLVNAQGFEHYFYQNESLCALFDEMIEEYERQSFGHELMMEGSFLRILAIILRTYFHDAREEGTELDYVLTHVRKILQYLAYHYQTCNSLEHVASEIGLSKNYMCRIFKEHTGCTVIRYVNQLRCYKAMSLIAGGMPISKVALTVGYSDYNYFSRIFKQIMGYKPSDLYKPKRPEGQK